MKSGILALGVVGFQWTFLDCEFGGDGGNGLGWQSLYLIRYE